jgi:hypothetical protein
MYQLSTHPMVQRLRKKTPLFFEFSLCLSRACLGKMIDFKYKWRKKWRYSHPSHRVVSSPGSGSCGIVW